MNRIFLRDVNNKKINPELVRYFKYQNDYYLIYTFHEIDEKNFMTLYVVKVMEELGQPIAKNLSNDWEWKNMQIVVKQMLREIKRNQILSFEDADIETINGMKIMSARSFKLLSSLVQILSGELIEPQKPDHVQPEAPLELEFSNETKKIEELTINDKISMLNQLKQENYPQIEQNQMFPISEELNLTSIIPIATNTLKEDLDSIASMVPNTIEILDDPIIDIEPYRKLKEENETLKQQLLYYQTKYQAIKDLLLKDE